MKYNNELQKIDTEEKAYILGLFYSDGYVCSTNNNCGITLHSNDIELLQKLNLKFPFFKIRNSHKNAHKLDCTSKKLKIDLINNGVHLLKSSVNRELLSIPNIDNSLIPHFIRGFFDGDGCVFLQRNNNLNCEIGCTSFNFITQFLFILYKNKISFNMNCKYSGTGLRTLDYYRIYCSSYKVAVQFANYIYKDATIYLNRKYNLLNKEWVDNKRERIQCNLCKSSNTKYSGGIRNNKIRIFCNNCKKHSSYAAPINSNINSVDVQTIHKV